MVLTYILCMQQCRSICSSCRNCRNYMWKVKSLSQNALLWCWSSIWLFFTFWSNSELRRLLPNSGSCTAGQHLSLLTGMSEKEKTQNFSRGCWVVQLGGSLTVHIWITHLAHRSKHFCQNLLNQFSLLLHQKSLLKTYADVSIHPQSLITSYKTYG